MAKKIDKQALRAKIQELQIDNNLKSELLAAISEQKPFGLVWEDHPEDAEERLRNAIPMLREDKNAAIISDATDAPNHVIIEGDNLEALTALAYSHEGKVDVIYIDPPYNTGKRDDFVYNDCYIDKEDSYRHSKWLSFMEKRLRLAKKLLSENGVIFISIDDNEQANLRLLCDDIFGHNNFITDIIWRSSDSSNHDAKQFSADYNNTLLYSKSEGWQPNKIARTEENNAHYKNPDNDPNGPWFSSNVSSPNPRQNLMFDIVSPQGHAIHAPKNGWRWSYETMQGFIDNGSIIFVDNGTRLIKKTYLKDQEGLVPSNIWWDIEVTGHNRNAKYELKKIFPEYKTSDIFKTPKPTKFIKRILELSTTKDSIILDFFAGSGTTLHSAMLLNLEDGGHRMCILANSNEEGICRNFTYERNNRVINGYKLSNGNFVEGLKANNLRYFTTEFIPRENTSSNRHALMRASVDLLCIKENIYNELETFGGRKFKKSVLRYFEEGDKQMLVIFDERVISLVIPMIAQVAKKESPMKVYVYSDGQYAYEDEFHEVMPLIDLCALPDAIYQALNNVLPEREYSEEMVAEFNQVDAEAALADTYNYKAEEGGAL